MALIFLQFIILTSLYIGCFTTPQKVSSCDVSICKPPNCRCSGTDIPGNLSRSETPQFVLFTFDDAVTVLNNVFYQTAFNYRNNSDGCPVSATFFTSHEYTDYSLINQLYHQGHEIALHSISHRTSTEYWRSINTTQLNEEFVGERQLISKFANIPLSALQGIRLPFLQMNGDSSFEMLNRAGMIYDCSWPTQLYTNPGLWPYTLNFASTQDCVIGPCPEKKWNGTWVVPMLTWKDPRGYPCSMVDTCGEMPDNANDLLEFMIENFNRSYHTNKAPFGFYVHAAWFYTNPVHFETYLKFIDYLQELDDVYFVGVSQAIKWIQQPVSLSKMKSTNWSKCRQAGAINCEVKVCRLLTKSLQERYMTICATKCPNSYPWLGNPLGE